MAGKKRPSPVMAAVKGAIIGGIAVAGAMTLADEKKREQIKDTFEGAKDKVTGFVEDKKEAVIHSADKIKNTIGKAAEDIKEA